MRHGVVKEADILELVSSRAGTGTQASWLLVFVLVSSCYCNKLQLSRLNNTNILSYISGCQKSKMSLTLSLTGLRLRRYDLSRLKLLLKSLIGNPFSFQLLEAICFP